MSADLQRSAGHETVVVKPQAEGSLATYIGVGILLFVFTILEVVVLKTPLLAGIQKPLITVLAFTNFAVAALYYQGLQYDHPMNKLVFAFGVGLGLIFGGATIWIMQLGVTPGQIGLGG